MRHAVLSCCVRSAAVIQQDQPRRSGSAVIADFFQAHVSYLDDYKLMISALIINDAHTVYSELHRCLRRLRRIYRQTV